jgi:hypothetical protein
MDKAWACNYCGDEDHLQITANREERNPVTGEYQSIFIAPVCLIVLCTYCGNLEVDDQYNNPIRVITRGNR